MGNIKPIETRYNGRRFRSRLEARWAVFFDALGLEWHYEPEGYETSVGRYLPDFYLPTLNYWLEIKPNEKDVDYETKALADIVAAHGGTAFILMNGVIRPSENVCDNSGAHLVAPGWDCYYRWCECHHCGRIELQFDSRSNRMTCKRRDRFPCPRMPGHDDKGYNPRGKRLWKAFDAALSARFEFGEEG